MNTESTKVDETEKSVKPAIEVADMDDEQDEKPNDRLLKESKKNKEKWQQERQKALELQAKLESIEREKLEAQGKEKERAEYYKTQYETLKKQLVKKNVEDAVTDFAKKLGCTKPKAVLQLGNKTLLQYDEASGEVLGTESFVEDVKKEYPEFFSKEKKSVVNTSIPATKAAETNNKDPLAKAFKGSTKDFSEMLGKTSFFKKK